MFYPSSGSTTNTFQTYMYDGYFFYKNQLNTYVGGSYQQSDVHGLFLSSSANYSYHKDWLGSRLMKLPDPD